MEIKHTPGPWKVHGQANVFAGDRPVANCSVVSSNIEWEKYDAENRANAEFIASAPTLAAEVERLNNLVNYLGDAIKEERTKSKNQKEVNGILSRRNKKLEAEVSRLQAQVEVTREALTLAINYLVTIAHDENHIVLQRLRAALGGEK